MGVRSLLLRTVQRPVGADEESLRSRQVVETLPSLDGSPEHRLDYVKALMALAADDMRQVTVYVTAAFALTALLLTRDVSDYVFDAPQWVRVVLALGIASLGGASLAFFRYVRKLHLTRMALARCIPQADAVRAREIWAGRAGVWAVHQRAYNLGLGLFGLGLGAEAVVLVAAVLQVG